MIDGNATGDVMFYGKGAGKLATASAVVADMMDAMAHREKRRPVEWGDGSKHLLRSLDPLTSRWYIRMDGKPAEITEPMTTSEAETKFAGAAARMGVL